jgi:hypothetical protein
MKRKKVSFSWRGGEYLKEWECVQLGHHKDIGRTIEKREMDGEATYLSGSGNSYACKSLFTV